MSLELNKIAAAVLTGGIIAMGTGFIADVLMHSPELEESVYRVGPVEVAEDSAPQEPALEPVLPLLADASAADGEGVAKKCSACHSFEKGGPHKVGPNLYGVIGGSIAAAEGYSYSEALQGVEDETWTYEAMNAFLAAPKEYAPGTKMSFAGLSKVSDRADMIAYLRQQHDSAPALPSEAEIEAAMGGGEEEMAAEEEMASEEEMAAEEEMASEEEMAAEGETMAEEAETMAEDAGDSAAEGLEETKEAAEQLAESASEMAEGGGGLAAMVAEADPEDGAKAARVCKACHSFEKGGPNKVGPNLWNTIGSDIASVEGYSYSSALEGLEGEWTLENMDAFLEAPRDYAPGTKMSFAGISKEDKRAALLAYLHSLSDNPAPLE